MAIPKQLAFEAAEYERRLDAVQREMHFRGTKLLLLFSPHSIYYLSGMDSENLFDFQCLLVPQSGESMLVIYDFELARFENSAWVKNVRTYGTFDDPVTVTADAARAFASPSDTIGLEVRSHQLSADIFSRLTAAIQHFEIADAFGIVERCRLVKSHAEIEYMRRSAALTDRGVQAGVAALVQGRPDHEVAAKVIGALYAGGSDTVCWGPIVAAGYRAGCAHSSFNGYKMQQGDTVFFELTGETRRYTAPLMRTAVLGQPSDEIRRVEEAGVNAIAAILEHARAGVNASTVAGEAQRRLEPVLDRVVFHYQFGYPVGIGYPASWIEELGYVIRADNDRPLEAGMVFHLPISLRKFGEYGVNLSHTILIGEGVAEALTKSEARLTVVDL